MTEDYKHPITAPPPHLLKKFSAQAQDETKKRNGAGYLKTFATLCIEWAMNSLATRAAQWGADQELEACCEWLFENDYDVAPACLRAARRPKLLTLKEQALEQLGCIETYLNKFGMGISTDTIRRALEALDD